MNAPNKGLMALETRNESGQSSLQAVHASRRAPVKLIDAALLTALTKVKALVPLAFSAVS